MTYRIVADRDSDEEAWLKARRELITASESAHLMGLIKGSWAMTEEQMADRKRSGATIPSTPLLAAGRWWEGSIIRYVSDICGLDIQDSSALYISDQHPFMGATPDGLLEGGMREPAWDLAEWLTVIHDFETYKGPAAVTFLREVFELNGSRAILEVKNQESKRRSKWNKEAGGPDYYENQVKHQLAVLDDFPIGLLAAKVDANELYIHVIDTDRGYQELLIETCRDFAQKYLTGA